MKSGTDTLVSFCDTEMSGKDSRKQRKRKSISLERKLEILNRLEKLEKPSSIAKFYGINESTIRTIKKMEKSIRTRVSSGCLPSLNCSSYTRNPAMETMEKLLISWIEDNTQKKIPINSSMIRKKAVNIYNNLKMESSSSDQHQPNFSGSKGWFEKFKKRYSLQNLKFKGFDNINGGEENELLADHELTDDELIHVICETHLANESGSDSDKADSFTAENIFNALQLARKLESTIVDIDPNTQRALKFQQDLKNCCSEYQEIYENLTKNNYEKKSPEKRHTDNATEVEVLNISSDEDSTLEPNKKNRIH